MKLIEATVSRLILGPRNEVFDAWLDPERPGGPWYGAKMAIVQAKPDGLFYFGLERSPQMNPHFGRFITVERPRQLVHTWMSEKTHGLESTVEIAFEARSGGTQMTLVHRGLPDKEAGRAHEKAWNYILDLYEKQFAEAVVNDGARVDSAAHGAPGAHVPAMIHRAARGGTRNSLRSRPGKHNRRRTT